MKIVKKNSPWLPSLLDEFFPENRLDAINYERFSIPSVNIKEDFSNFVIELAVPGLKKEAIAIEVEKNLLKVSSKKTSQEEKNEEKEGVKFTRKEFNFSSFERSFTLPDLINVDAIQAHYENGIVSIALPKIEEAKSIKKMVEIS
ncbi:MAG: Hsp20/alpha crystallin family protein [Flavobacteriaceae bacterium]